MLIIQLTHHPLFVRTFHPRNLGNLRLNEGPKSEPQQKKSFGSRTSLRHPLWIHLQQKNGQNSVHRCASWPHKTSSRNVFRRGPKEDVQGPDRLWQSTAEITRTANRFRTMIGLHGDVKTNPKLTFDHSTMCMTCTAVYDMYCYVSCRFFLTSLACRSCSEAAGHASTTIFKSRVPPDVPRMRIMLRRRVAMRVLGSQQPVWTLIERPLQSRSADVNVAVDNRRHLCLQSQNARVPRTEPPAQFLWPNQAAVTFHSCVVSCLHARTYPRQPRGSLVSLVLAFVCQTALSQRYTLLFEKVTLKSARQPPSSDRQQRSTAVRRSAVSVNQSPTWTPRALEPWRSPRFRLQVELARRSC